MANQTDTDPLLVDARGLKCPWPALRAARAMRENEEVALLSDDPAARIEITALAHANGWSIQVSDLGNHLHFGLKKAAGSGPL